MRSPTQVLQLRFATGPPPANWVPDLLGLPRPCKHLSVVFYSFSWSGPELRYSPSRRLSPLPGCNHCRPIACLPPCRGRLVQDQSTHLLLEYRCTRYFYMEGAGTFVPVPAVAKGFNAQLQRAAETLAATGQATALDEQDWDLPDKQLRWGQGGRNFGEG